MDGFPEFKLIQKRLETAEREVETLRADVNALQKGSQSLRADLDRLALLVIGDEEFGLSGVAERIKKLEGQTRWLMIGVGASVATGLLTLVKVWF